MLSLARQTELIRSSHAIVDKFGTWLHRKQNMEDNPHLSRYFARPFDPWYNTQTGRWWPAPISARREARIVLAAYRTGRLDEIPDGAKKTKMLRRIASAHRDETASDSHVLAHGVGSAEGTNGRMWAPLREWQAAERRRASETGLAQIGASEQAKNAGLTGAESQRFVRKAVEECEARLPPLPSKPSWEDMGANTFQKVVRSLKEKDIRIHQSQIIKELVSVKGPYTGRIRNADKDRTQGLRVFFKGTKQERQRPARQREIAANMAEMENLIRNFRQKQRAEVGSSRMPDNPLKQ